MSKKRRKCRRIKKLNLYLLIISIIWLFLIFLNTVLVFNYDVLPFKYLIIFLLLVVILPILFIYLFTRKKISKVLKVFISIIGIIYILVLGFSFFYLNKTFSFLDSFTSGYKYETKNYLVVVLKDSSYKEISDLKDKKIGYVNSISHDISKGITKLDSEISYEHSEYKDYTNLLLSLSNKEIEGVLMGDSYFEMLKEEDSEFISKYKIIYKFSLTEKVEEIKKEVDVLKDTFNIYISGIDSYGDVSSLTRSDVNIVVSVNPKTNQILLVNIPRDYYVKLHDTEEKDKLTHAGLYGIDMSSKTIEDLLDIEINYYLRVNYAALVNLVDALGGVDVYSKYSFTSAGKGYYFKKGYNHVNGLEALDFVRTRKAFLEGDRVRGENQQAMISAIIKKAMSPSILTSYSNILNSLTGSFATNMGTDNITELVKMQLDKMPSWNITSVSLTGSDGSGYTYTYPYQELYVMIPNEENLLSVKEKLISVKDGEMLDSSYDENTGSVNTPTLSKPKEPSKKQETPKVDNNDSAVKEDKKEETENKDKVKKEEITSDINTSKSETKAEEKEEIKESNEVIDDKKEEKKENEE